MTDTHTTAGGIPHSEIVGPTGITREKENLYHDENYSRTLYVSSWPPTFKAGLLDKLFTAPGSAVEVAIHQTPVPRDESIKNYTGAINDLKSAIRDQKKRDSARLSKTKKRLKQHEQTKQQLEDGDQRIHKVSVYITLRKRTVEELNSLENTVRNELTPAQLTLERASRAHEKAIASTSPIALDEMGKTHRLKTAALATLFPFSSDTIMEQNGVLWGYHAVTGSPVLINRFDRENGYNVLFSGMTGSGKTFGSKVVNLRERSKFSDYMFIVVDPLSDFTRFVNQLHGEDVTIGGMKGLNPMDISPTPDHVLERKPDLNPFGKKLDGVSAFLNDFFADRDVSFDHDVTVRGLAVAKAYERAGITADPSTHHKQSPTIRKVDDDIPSLRGVLKDIDEHPDEFVPNASEAELEKYSSAATDVRMELLPFCENQPYAHLGGRNDVSISDDSTVINMDMQQAEQRGDVGLMMMQMLDASYEIAKQSNKRVVLCIDEAHLLLNNEFSLNWLARVTRHARHHNLSVMLLTQRIEDFLTSDKRRDILGNIDLRAHFHESTLDPKHVEAMNLTPREGDFLRDAKPGDWDRGYSHALLVADGDKKIPIKVTALRREAAMIDDDLANRFGVA